jgi:hypothetical protein
MNKLNSIQKDSLSQEELEALQIPYRSIFDEDEIDINSSKTQRFYKPTIISKYISKPIDKITKLKSKVDDVIKQIAQKAKKALEENKDKFQIEVIAFNEGNTQTVIRYKGLIELGSTQLNLKKSGNQRIEDYYTKLSNAMAGKASQGSLSSNYLIIEPKSFIVLNIEIDNFNNKNRDVEVIKREYLSGQSSVLLTLFDIKNNPIRPFSFKLQNDVEYDPNEELNKFVTTNLTAFIENK